MLYQVYEMQRTMLEPFAELALTASNLFTNPMMPVRYMPNAKRMAAGYNLLHRLVKDYEKPQFGITSITVNGAPVTIRERVEVQKPFCNLLRFKRYADDTRTLEALLHQPAVLIVAPLSGHYATLLRDTVKTMLHDHKVYITDWKNARNVSLDEGSFHLDDYVHYVQDFIRHVQQADGECHVVSVCQPTVPVMAAVSLMASRGEKTPETMTMMGGPVDATQSPTVVNDLATRRSIEWFENNLIYRVPPNYPGAGRHVYPGFLQYAGFIAMNPNRHAVSHYDYFKDLIRGDGESSEAHRRFYDEYNAVLDMDAHFYLDTIRTVFQEFRLVNGTWDVRHPDGHLERVRPQDITRTAVLAVEGELDDISGSGQTQASITLCTGVPEQDKQYFEVKGAGHYGIFSGRRWREICYPVLRDFIAQRHAPDVYPPRQAQSAAQHAHLEKIEQTHATTAAQAPTEEQAPAKKQTAPASQAAASTRADKTAVAPAPQAPAAAPSEAKADIKADKPATPPPARKTTPRPQAAPQTVWRGTPAPAAAEAKPTARNRRKSS